MSGVHALAHHPLVRRLVKYASVSVIASLTSLTVLAVLVGVVGISPVWANIIAVGIGTLPSFELNRRWVWCLAGQRIRAAQVIPFCLLSFSSLVLSSFAVRAASAITVHDSRLLHTAVIEAANISTYGALWGLQFVLCNHFLFRSRRLGPRRDVVVSSRESRDRAGPGSLRRRPSRTSPSRSSLATSRSPGR